MRDNDRVTRAVGPARAVADIDLWAYAANVRALKRRIGSAQLLCVVKADAYGHGAEQCAATARAAGADWLGVAFVDEALALRAAGDRGPLLAWILNEHDDLAGAIARDVDLSISSMRELELVLDAYHAAGAPPRVHVEVDTGLSRGGVAPGDWDAVFAAVRDIDVVSVWSHLACADEPTHPANDAQRAAFERALAVAASQGVTPRLRHLANSAATLTRPDLHFDLVRVGMASYGVSPMDDNIEQFGLEPVMTVRARIAQVRTVPAGTGVSYGHHYVTDADTRLALVPLGYADGVPRAASNRAPVAIDGARRTIAGTVCMDQFVIDVGATEVEVGDDVVLFGAGGPSAEEWARVCGTIGYELTTRLGVRLARRFHGGV